MKRDISQLGERTFDILIVGSGIYGALLAREAALRGLSVTLIDQGDFGSATSANSLKVVHGGLRYLQHFNLVRMRESIRARRQLLTIAPYLVRPQAFMVPTYGWGLQSKWVMRAAFLFNDIISFDRNKGLAEQQRISRGKILSRKQCLQAMPCVDENKLTGAAVWMDGFIEDTERLMISIIHSAVEQGACAANYVAAESYLRDKNRVCGVLARDVLTGGELKINAKFVINATGPGAEKLDAGLKPDVRPKALTWVKAFNVFIKKPIVGTAGIGLSSTTQNVDQDSLVNRGKRLYFFVPWKGGTLVGTDYVKAESLDNSAVLSDEELDNIITEINLLHPCAELSRVDVAYCHAGYLPANSDESSTSADSRILKHTSIVDHQADSGIEGLLTVTGIKYTVASQVVIDVINRVSKNLSTATSRPVEEPLLYGSSSQSEESEASTLLQNLPAHLYSRYGNRVAEIIKFADEDAGWLQSLSSTTDTIIAEVIHAIREELAMTLSDVIFRRSGMAINATPDSKTIQRCADIMATEHGWSAERIKEEIVGVEKIRTMRKG